MSATEIEIARQLAESPVHLKIELIRHGATLEQLMAVHESLGVPFSRLSGLLPVSEASLSRRRRDGKPLDERTSEVIVRLAEFLLLATQAFDDREAGRAWLVSPNPALGGAAPIDWLDTEYGAREVRRLLTNIEYGGAL